MARGKETTTHCSDGQQVLSRQALENAEEDLLR